MELDCVSRSVASDARGVGDLVGGGRGAWLDLRPPVFADFAGKQWEGKFPEYMDSYYALCGRYLEGWNGGEVESGNSGRVVVDVEQSRAVGVGFGIARPVVDVGGDRSDGQLGRGQRDGLHGGGTGVGFVGVGDAGDERSGGFARVERRDVESGARPVGVLGPNGGLSIGRGANYARNQEDRDRKRAARVVRGNAKVGVESVGGVDRKKLQGSLEQKWAAENALAAEKAKQQLELLCARDLTKVKAMQSAQVMRTTERCKVDTEKAFGFLAKTGNVPGFAETVVSGEGVVPSLSSGSRSAGTCISPDSSVSQQEIRQMQKDLLDAQRMIDRLRVQCPKEVEHVELNLGVKTAFTLNSDGSVPIEEDGCMGSDGKFHTENYVKDPTYVMTSRQMQLLRDAGCEEF
jgi:hypothetical protein